MAFPGGSQAAGDASLAATALRETEEEVGVAPGTVRLVGQLDPVPTQGSGFLVTPVVGLAQRTVRPRPDGVEVASWFSLPLAALLAHRPEVEARPLADGASSLLYRYELEGHTVWGASARILHELLERIRGAS